MYLFCTESNFIHHSTFCCNTNSTVNCFLSFVETVYLKPLKIVYFYCLHVSLFCTFHSLFYFHFSAIYFFSPIFFVLVSHTSVDRLEEGYCLTPQNVRWGMWIYTLRIQQTYFFGYDEFLLCTDFSFFRFFCTDHFFPVGLLT